MKKGIPKIRKTMSDIGKMMSDIEKTMSDIERPMSDIVFNILETRYFAQNRGYSNARPFSSITKIAAPTEDKKDKMHDFSKLQWVMGRGRLAREFIKMAQCLFDKQVRMYEYGVT